MFLKHTLDLQKTAKANKLDKGAQCSRRNPYFLCKKAAYGLRFRTQISWNNSLKLVNVFKSGGLQCGFSVGSAKLCDVMESE